MASWHIYIYIFRVDRVRYVVRSKWYFGASILHRNFITIAYLVYNLRLDAISHRNVVKFHVYSLTHSLTQCPTHMYTKRNRFASYAFSFKPAQTGEQKNAVCIIPVSLCPSQLVLMYRLFILHKLKHKFFKMHIKCIQTISVDSKEAKSQRMCTYVYVIIATITSHTHEHIHMANARNCELSHFKILRIFKMKTSAIMNISCNASHFLLNAFSHI